METNDLRCCGNCGFFTKKDDCPCIEIIDNEIMEIECPSPNSVCDKWVFDNLTSKERMNK
jgi:rRNA maturation protein Nop10